MRPSLPNALVGLQLLLFALLAASAALFPVQGNAVLRLIGTAWVVVGLWVVFDAIRQHRINDGVNITPLPRPQSQLIQTGAYAYVRHPIYTGVIVSGLGIAMLHGHIGPILVAASLIPFFTVKSLVEERYLQATYPGYAAYQRRTGRFLPPVTRRRTS